MVIIVDMMKREVKTITIDRLLRDNGKKKRMSKAAVWVKRLKQRLTAMVEKSEGGWSSGEKCSKNILVRFGLLQIEIRNWIENASCEL